ncbi:hypothetical protein Bca4012_043723 [Brassica carinata]
MSSDVYYTPQITATTSSTTAVSFLFHGTYLLRCLKSGGSFNVMPYVTSLP